MGITRVSRHLKASRARVYRALLDGESVARWKVPSDMACQVHTFDGRVGKTSAHTDTYHGRFVTLVPDELVVEVDEFETADSAQRGEMTITITLADADGGTDLVAVHVGLPPGVSPADNETGWRESLARLAALVEASPW